MKTLKYIIGLILISCTSVIAQGNFTRPDWAPSAPANVQYYYLPDIGVYYDAEAKQYISSNNGTWSRSSELPSQYKGYDLKQSNPIFLTNYKGHTPYVLFREHKVKHKGNGKWKI